MTRTKRAFGAGVLLFFILLTVLPAASVAATQVTFSPSSHAKTAAILLSTPLFRVTSEVGTVALFAGEIRSVLAQEIPNVLTPTVAPSAEPTLSVPTATVQPSATQKNASSTTTGETGNSVSFEKIIGSISPLFIIALIPLLFIIGALFYFFFMGDHYHGTPDEGQKADADRDEVLDDEWRQL